MIKWKTVDPNYPPDGEKLFLYNGSVYSGWIINTEDGILSDDDGYPLWETSENLLGKCHYVRYYADLNYPQTNI
jgi:hypothetical protein